MPGHVIMVSKSKEELIAKSNELASNLLDWGNITDAYTVIHNLYGSMTKVMEEKGAIIITQKGDTNGKETRDNTN